MEINKNGLLKKLSQHSVWYLLGSFLNNGLSLLLLPYLTNMLTPEEYGIIQTANSVGLCLPIMFSLYIDAAFSRFYHDEKNNTYRISILFSTSFWFIVFNGIIVLSILAITSWLWFESLFETGPYPLIFLITYPYIFYQISILGSSYLRQVFKVKNIACIDFLSSLVNLSLSIYLVYIWPNGAEARLTAIAVAFIVKAIYYIYYFSRHKILTFSFHWKKLKSLCSYSVPLIPGAISLWITKMSDRVIISIFAGTASTALFSVANQIALIVYFIQDGIMQAINPIQMDNFIKNKRATLKYSVVLSQLMWIFIVIIIVFMGLFSDLILDIFINEKFYVDSYLIIVLSTVYLFQAQYRIFSGILLYYKKTKEYSYAAIVQSVVSIVLNLCLIPFLGYKIAAFSSSVSVLIFLIMILYYVGKLESLNCNYSFYFKYFSLLFIILFFDYLLEEYYTSIYIMISIKLFLLTTCILFSIRTIISKLKELNIIVL